jgi:hypothetical protein
LKRCQARNLSTIAAWGATVGAFCEQGGCRLMESPARIYSELLWCGKDSQGAWGVSLDPPVFKGRKGEEEGPEAVRLSGSLTVVRVSAQPDGSLVEVDLPGKALDYSLDWFSMVAYRHQLSDLDGDGVAELILRQNSTVEESPENNSTVLTAYRIRDGAIESIPEIADLHAIDMVDADRDGRIDFVLPSPFVTTYPCISECTYRGPSLLAHTTRDGRLERVDSVAIDHVRRQCDRPPSDPDFPLYEWFQIACDRFAGDPVATTLTRLRQSRQVRENTIQNAAQLDESARRWASTPIPFQIPRKPRPAAPQGSQPPPASSPR